MMIHEYFIEFLPCFAILRPQLRPWPCHCHPGSPQDVDWRARFQVVFVNSTGRPEQGQDAGDALMGWHPKEHGLPLVKQEL